MTRLDWYIVAILLAGGLVVHAVVPRYEWRSVAGNAEAHIRIDRWTGHAERGVFATVRSGIAGVPLGRWVSLEDAQELLAEAAARARRPAPYDPHNTPSTRSPAPGASSDVEPDILEEIDKVLEQSGSDATRARPTRR